MSFNVPNNSNLSIISEVDGTERVIRPTDVQSALSCHTARASREIISHEAEIMDTGTQALKDYDRKDAEMEMRTSTWRMTI